MRRLQLITCAFWLAILGHALARGQEPTADLLPALLAVDVEPQSNGGAQAPVPAPVADHEGQPAQAISTAPPAAGSFIEHIEWMTVEEAKASPKPDFFFVSNPDLQACPPCMMALTLMQDQRCLRWLALFDCVEVDRIAGERPTYPTFVFASADWKRYKRFKPGNPVRKTAHGTATDAEAFMRRFSEAWGIVK